MSSELIWPVCRIEDEPFQGFELESAHPLMSTKHEAPLALPTPAEI